MQFYLIVVLLFALSVAGFALQNATTVDIRVLFWTFEDISLSLVVLGSVAAGAVIAFVLGLGRQIRLVLRIKELTARVADMQHRMGQEHGKAANPAVPHPARKDEQI
ncbi:MAG: LapA family protein [Thermoanaerobacterales bacterium]|nr:LapA family protein [Bacillota bacterium]MDI6907789.1 LapA family protein [Thermoanaerobacterales bacterium]